MGGGYMDNITENELAVTDENRDLALYKSIYYQMNAKPDSMSKAFSRKVIVNKDDIIDLNNRINEKIKLNYQDDGYIATVTVCLKDRHVLTFKCWEEFLQHKWTETSCIIGISLQWNFNIRIPGYEKPQNHNLVVKLTNGLRPEEILNFIFSGNIEDFDEIELNAFPVVVRVDFIQTLLGEELINIVGNWVNGLTQNTDLKNPIIMLMKKYRQKIAQYFEYISLIMLVFLLIGIFSNYLKSFNVINLNDLSMNQFNNMCIVILTGVLILYLLKNLFKYTAHSIYEKLSEYGNVYIFNITRGDSNLQNAIKTKDKTNGKIILTKFFLSLFFNICCGIIATLLI